MQRQSTIYAIISPDTGLPVYVGKTSQPLNGRLRSHSYKSKKGTTKISLWVRAVLDRGLTVTADVLEVVDVASSGDAERRWAAKLSHHGLLNMAVPGGGNPGAGRVDWTDANLAILGTMSDSRAAKVIGCDRKTVAYRRECLSIAASGDRTMASPPPKNGGWNKINLPPAIMARLGLEPDYIIAKDCGIDKSVVSRVRKELGIDSCAANTGRDGRIKLGDPHRRWQREGSAPPVRPPDAIHGKCR